MAHLSHFDALFLLAPLPRAERRQLAHALVCDSCRAVLREVLEAQTPAPRQEPPSRFSRPIDYSAMWTALEAKLAAEVPDIFREREAAQRELEKLLRLRRDHRAAVARPSAALALLLLDRSAEVTASDPREAEHLARLVITLVGKLDVARVPVTLLAELNSQAWALVGNARRHRRDLTGADFAFLRAQARLDLATDLAVNATFCRLLAELRREQGRNEEARALQERARTLFAQVHKLADSTSGPDIPPGAGSQET
ncbi:MAG TPA: hypothetical protein VGC93_00845 [Thermoanaerobaculia bacterium]